MILHSWHAIIWRPDKMRWICRTILKRTHIILQKSFTTMRIRCLIWVFSIDIFKIRVLWFLDTSSWRLSLINAIEYILWRKYRFAHILSFIKERKVLLFKYMWVGSSWYKSWIIALGWEVRFVRWARSRQGSLHLKL